MPSLLTFLPHSLIAHAPALLICVPLVLAALMSVQPSGRLAWVMTLIAAAAALLFSLILFALVQQSPADVLSYDLGQWPVPLGIEFRIDAVTVFVLLLVAVMGLLAAVFAWPPVAAEIAPEKRPMFFAMFTLCLLGLCGVVITGDAFNLFVFLEIASLSAYTLVALGAEKDRRALPAAFNYLIMGTIGATFYVIGIGFLYAATGTLNMADLAARLPALTAQRSVQAGFAFILVGLGLKAAMWPLHLWLPNAYTRAPAVVTVLLAAAATKVALYALIRFMFAVFQPDTPLIIAGFNHILMPLGVIALLVCSVQAAFQTDMRRMLAYSGVAQMGYVLLGLSLATLSGVSAALLQLVAHGFIIGALFMAVAAIMLVYGGTSVRDFAGLGRAAPWTVAGFAVSALSLIGLPLTLGFQAKLQLGFALFERGQYGAIAALVAATLLALVYIGRLLVMMFFEPPRSPRTTRKEAPLLMLVPIWLTALLNLFFGMAGNLPITLARQAAAALGLGAAP
jgi:multicomponent Na+:H+ antiporter subunit D